jgi:hypothetical protein
MADMVLNILLYLDFTENSQNEILLNCLWKAWFLIAVIWGLTRCDNHIFKYGSKLISWLKFSQYNISWNSIQAEWSLPSVKMTVNTSNTLQETLNSKENSLQTQLLHEMSNSPVRATLSSTRVTKWVLEQCWEKWLSSIWQEQTNHLHLIARCCHLSQRKSKRALQWQTSTHICCPDFVFHILQIFSNNMASR